VPGGRSLSATAALWVAVFVLVSISRADSAGRPSPKSDGSPDMTYVALGLAVLVGGFMVYDAVTDAAREKEPASHPPMTVDTGVDWDSLEKNTSDDRPPLVGVHVFPGPGGRETAQLLLEAMKKTAHDDIIVYEDPVDFGNDPGPSYAKLVGDYLGLDYLVFGVFRDDSSVVVHVTSSDSLLWTYTLQGNNVNTEVKLLAPLIMEYGIPR